MNRHSLEYVFKSVICEVAFSSETKLEAILAIKVEIVSELSLIFV